MPLPNIILFTWHDAGDWFGCYGHTTVHTPNVDRLAAEGVQFDNCFSACAICSPSRAAIATGRFCQSTGVMTLTNTPLVNRIAPHIPHLSVRLKREGYDTALFGVCHEAAHEHVAGILRPDEQFATDPWPGAHLQIPYVRQYLAGRAKNDRPFFAQIGTFEAHLNRFYTGRPARADEACPPCQDTEHGLARPGYLVGSDADRATVATLQGLLRRGDTLMGAVLEALDKNGLAENTLVIMCVDHGVGLTRAKTTCYDAGTKVAWLMRWPGVIPAGHVVGALTTHVDVTPTVLNLIGKPAADGFDGVDLSAHATGRTSGEIHDAVFSHMVENTRGLRTSRWRFVRNFRPTAQATRKGDCASQHEGFDEACPLPKAAADQTPDELFPLIELYDSAGDPDNLRNFAGSPAHAAVCRQLDDRLWRFLCESDDFVFNAPVRDAWDAANRRDLEAWCARAGQTPPRAEGPAVNAIDQATREGRSATAARGAV